MILVDTCVLNDISASDQSWRDWSIEQLVKWRLHGPLVINPIVFAEWCADFDSFEAARSALQAFGLQWAELPQQALFLASQAHRLYRRRGGQRAMVLPDFLVGAHAAVTGMPLLTRDRRRFDSYLAGLEIVAPE